MYRQLADEAMEKKANNDKLLQSLLFRTYIWDLGGWVPLALQRAQVIAQPAEL